MSRVRTLPISHIARQGGLLLVVRRVAVDSRRMTLVRYLGIAREHLRACHTRRLASGGGQR